MEKKIQAQFIPFIKKKGQKYRVISITDIQVHSSIKRPTAIGKVAAKHQDKYTPYRAYTSFTDWNVPREKQIQMILEILQNDSSYNDYYLEQEKLGYKILFDIPDPIPLLLGKDTEDFLNSKKRGRFVRWSAKNK
jgi:hypothetical protein